MNRRVTSHCLTVCRCDGSREGRPPVKKSLYGERDYAFGQLVLTLRTTIGLTQAGLGERLGVSRRAVAEWEGGLSYPKAERLKELITLGVRASAFPARGPRGSARREPVRRPRGGSGRTLAVDRAGALPPGHARGHGRHRQEYAGLLPGKSPGAPVRGGALALGARRPALRGTGRRLHHLLFRDPARRLPLVARAAYHAAALALAGPPLPVGARQPGDAARERGP